MDGLLLTLMVIELGIALIGLVLAIRALSASLRHLLRSQDAHDYRLSPRSDLSWTRSEITAAHRTDKSATWVDNF